MPHSPWTSSFAAIAVVSGIPLVVTLLMALNERSVRSAIPFLTALGSGALLGAATVHLIPEALAGGQTPVAIGAGTLIGFALFALVERLLAARGATHTHGSSVQPRVNPLAASGSALIARAGMMGGYRTKAPNAAQALVPLAFTGDAVHNVMDGMLIAAGFLTNPGFGFLTAVAIGLHELPREVGTFGLFVHGGVHPLRAVLYNAATGVLSLAGAAVTLIVGAHALHFGEFLMPVAAGS
ncbi:MAG: ZIP family metal transporter, partial [Gemmatimonadota bacterium]|nr:ZIP family metal transporter [Gemmatimonadota bacterium]